MEIKGIKAKKILDSRGRPTVKALLETKKGVFSASVPSGTSRGKYEAKTIEPEEARRKIEKIIGPEMKEREFKNQKEVDDILLALDKTKDKSNLGANAVLAVSIASCRALAAEEGLALYRYIREIFNRGQPSAGWPRKTLPRPCFLMFEAGCHGQGTEIQEFMVVPPEADFKANLAAGKRIFSGLGRILKKEKMELRFGLEGGYTGFFSRADQILNSLSRAIKETGEDDVVFYIDAAASEFYKQERYYIEGRDLAGAGLAEFYKGLTSQYPISIIEDPFDQDDIAGWRAFSQTVNKSGRASRFAAKNILLVGDDLTTSNPERIRKARKENICSGIILKPNQIGTVSETLAAAHLAKDYGWKIVVSHRSGETMDDFIADLAVGIGAEFIKSGAPMPKERMAKYNRLVKIEKELNSNKLGPF